MKKSVMYSETRTWFFELDMAEGADLDEVMSVLKGTDGFYRYVDDGTSEEILFYSTLSATDQKSISLERAFQAMREDGAVSGTAVLTDIDPGCRAELNGFKPYLDTRIEVFNGQNGQKNVLAEAGKALSSGNLSAICDDYGMDYAVLNYGINDVGIQDLKESGFKMLYSDGLTVCLKRSTV